MFMPYFNYEFAPLSGSQQQVCAEVLVTGSKFFRGGGSLYINNLPSIFTMNGIDNINIYSSLKTMLVKVMPWNSSSKPARVDTMRNIVQKLPGFINELESECMREPQPFACFRVEMSVTRRNIFDLNLSDRGYHQLFEIFCPRTISKLTGIKIQMNLVDPFELWTWIKTQFCNESVVKFLNSNASIQKKQELMFDISNAVGMWSPRWFALLTPLDEPFPHLPHSTISKSLRKAEADLEKKRKVYNKLKNLHKRGHTLQTEGLSPEEIKLLLIEKIDWRSHSKSKNKVCWTRLNSKGGQSKAFDSKQEAVDYLLRRYPLTQIPNHIRILPDVCDL